MSRTPSKAAEIPGVLPTARLRRLGATPAVLRQAQASWSAMTEPERRQAWDAIHLTTDDELALRVRETEIELALPEFEGDGDLISGAAALIDEVPTGRMEIVTKWVGGSGMRAAAALAFEYRRHADERRRTLITALRRTASGG